MPSWYCHGCKELHIAGKGDMVETASGEVGMVLQSSHAGQTIRDYLVLLAGKQYWLYEQSIKRVLQEVSSG